jgi:hypothetical protein
MANSKSTRSRKRRSSRFIRFPEVKGKTVAQVEIDDDASAITISFKDKTALSFDFDSSHAVFTEFLDFQSGDSKVLKRWPRISSGYSIDWNVK